MGLGTSRAFVLADCAGETGRLLAPRGLTRESVRRKRLYLWPLRRLRSHGVVRPACAVGSHGSRRAPGSSLREVLPTSTRVPLRFPLAWRRSAPRRRSGARAEALRRTGGA